MKRVAERRRRGPVETCRTAARKTPGPRNLGTGTTPPVLPPCNAGQRARGCWPR